ncbi:Holliday junction resolvase RuvX [Actinocorallia longicatena]|uniref:Putative pre-16S rRNA nuclease n=1 Tax=Actinocorallia longicatena TaxID=111803 RepID=A0ABP6Q8D8_9ACTN
MRNGVRLAVDVGSVRIGVARSDPAGILATPLETVRAGRGDIARILELVAEYEALEVIVGLPANLSGREGKAAESARSFAVRLARKLPFDTVRLYDERLTTVTAASGLRSGGTKAKNQRAVIDQAAATVLLQAALDAERLTGKPPGASVKGRE